jgi:citrate synthase
MWEPPTDRKAQALLADLTEAHRACTLRNNPSTNGVMLAAQASGSYFQSLIAGLAMLGGLHGPLVATYDQLESPDPIWVRRELACGRKIPGWGSSFVKGMRDPLLQAVHDTLDGLYPEVMERIALIQGAMDSRKLFPNPSCYTAATALALGLPRESVGYLVVQARLLPWTNLFQELVKVPDWEK